jgi:hypothetical protein
VAKPLHLLKQLERTWEEAQTVYASPKNNRAGGGFGESVPFVRTAHRKLSRPRPAASVSCRQFRPTNEPPQGTSRPLEPSLGVHRLSVLLNCTDQPSSQWRRGLFSVASHLPPRTSFPVRRDRCVNRATAASACSARNSRPGRTAT